MMLSRERSTFNTRVLITRSANWFGAYRGYLRAIHPLTSESTHRAPNSAERLRRLTRGRTRRGPASARRPSRLVQRNLGGVTPPASRASNAGMQRAALPQPRGPWPRGLTSTPLGRHRSSRLHSSPPPGPQRIAHRSNMRTADALSTQVAQPADLGMLAAASSTEVLAK